MNLAGKKFNILIVGVGGTGGNLIRLFTQLAAHPYLQDKITATLIDGDVVEEKNTTRQPFTVADKSQNKAIVIAEKALVTYGFSYSVIPEYLEEPERLLSVIRESGTPGLPILIGCVDNHKARKCLHEVFNSLNDVVYLDAANEEWFGDVVMASKEGGKILSHPRAHYYPDLFTSIEEEPLRRGSCEARTMASAPQQLVTNLWAANILMSHLTLILLKKKLGPAYRQFDSEFMEINGSGFDQS